MTPEQVSAIVEGIRKSVKERNRKTLPAFPGFKLPELGDLCRARDIAETKVAVIGTVNPRPPGLMNTLVQAGKSGIARALNWFVREQIDFNQATLRYMDTQLEVTSEQNRAVLHVAQELATSHAELLKSLSEWRLASEEKLRIAEVQLLDSVRKVEASTREREAASENKATTRHSKHLEKLERLREDYSQALEQLQKDYDQALTRANQELQTQFWKNLETLKTDLDRLIHTELRLIRQRTLVPARQESEAIREDYKPLPAPSIDFDYGRFEERFRGNREYVKKSQKFYLPYFKDCRKIVDLGCGRGEFLELARAEGLTGIGVDLNPEAAASCHEKNIEIHQLDLFTFLTQQPDCSIDGVLCSHIMEHIPGNRLSEVIRLVAQKLKGGGVLAVETPNPSCLAIFSGDFYSDPTHQRPVPSRLMHFHLEEAGFTTIEIHERHPASDVFPELKPLAKVANLRDFRDKFFGGLDYAIVARKIK